MQTRSADQQYPNDPLARPAPGAEDSGGIRGTNRMAQNLQDLQVLREDDPCLRVSTIPVFNASFPLTIVTNLKQKAAN